MNVGELKAALAKVPDDMPVLLAADPEGNGFRKLDAIDTDARINVDEVNDWVIDGLVDEEDYDDYGDGELIQHVVLWP